MKKFDVGDTIKNERKSFFVSGGNRMYLFGDCFIKNKFITYGLVDVKRTYSSRIILIEKFNRRIMIK